MWTPRSWQQTSAGCGYFRSVADTYGRVSVIFSVGYGYFRSVSRVLSVGYGYCHRFLEYLRSDTGTFGRQFFYVLSVVFFSTSGLFEYSDAYLGERRVLYMHLDLEVQKEKVPFRDQRGTVVGPVGHYKEDRRQQHVGSHENIHSRFVSTHQFVRVGAGLPPGKSPDRGR